MRKFLNILYIGQIALVLLVAFGIVPRFVVPFWTLFLVIVLARIPLEDSVAFFARSIPFFIAIPLTMHFDSLNMWRILSIVIFLKWFRWEKIAWFLKRPWLKRPVFLSLMGLLGLSILSLIVAPSKVLAIKRIIYFVNLSLIGIVAYDLVSQKGDYAKRLVKNLIPPLIAVTLIGFGQLISTYFVDIYTFMRIWGEGVELGLFGQEWSNIAVQANTWFAYFGEQLSLRMFSIFPDSHSFPIFLLLAMPALFAWALAKVVVKAPQGLKAMLKTRAGLVVLFVPLVFLAAILSGTRGIWLAAVGVVLAVPSILLWMRHQRASKAKIAIFSYLSLYLSLFFLLFSIAFPIFASPQFLLAKDNTGVLGMRVRSILDAGETSNKRRLEIWEASAQSIIHHPILGVGIGNFPVVLGEDLAKAKAGSTAHNLYLHIPAEIGIAGLALALWFLGLLLKKTYTNFLEVNDSFMAVYYAMSLLGLLWVFIYCGTDPAIFDERAFLLFAIVCAVTFGITKKESLRTPPVKR